MFGCTLPLSVQNFNPASKYFFLHCAVLSNRVAVLEKEVSVEELAGLGEAVSKIPLACCGASSSAQASIE